MKWIASFLDAIFANLFADNKFLANMTGKIAGSVEELVYKVEAGNMNVSSLTHTMERLIFWLPIVFLICLCLDLLIRSRFVRYSYQDEYQAKKSVWWRWQSDADAALALESGAGSLQTLTDGMPESAEVVEEVPSAIAEETVEEPAEEAEQTEMIEQTEDTVDRGPVTSARQNQVRTAAPTKERAEGVLTDLRDQWTVIKGAIAFAPRTIARNARLRKQSMKEEARLNRERMQEHMQRGRTAKQRDEEAAAEAMFDTPQDAYVDADFEQNIPVNTGGIEDANFAHAAEVVREAMQQEKQTVAETPVEESPEA